MPLDALLSLSLQLAKMLRKHTVMMKLTILTLVAIAGLGEDAQKETGSVPPSAPTVTNGGIEARAWQVPLLQPPRPISQAGARLRPACPLMRPTIPEQNIMTCHLTQAVLGMATQHARLKPGQKVCLTSVDSLEPHYGRTPRHSAGRADPPA